MKPKENIDIKQEGLYHSIKESKNESVLDHYGKNQDMSPLLDRSNQNQGLGLAYGSNNTMSQGGLAGVPRHRPNESTSQSPGKKENRKFT